MKIKEIQALKDEQITEKVKELRKELIKLGAQVATGTTPKSPKQIRKSKKIIARLLTVQSQRRNQVK